MIVSVEHLALIVLEHLLLSWVKDRAADEVSVWSDVSTVGERRVLTGSQETSCSWISSLWIDDSLKLVKNGIGIKVLELRAFIALKSFLTSQPGLPVSLLGVHFVVVVLDLCLDSSIEGLQTLLNCVGLS